MSISAIPRAAVCISPTETFIWLKSSEVSPIWSVRAAPFFVAENTISLLSYSALIPALSNALFKFDSVASLVAPTITPTATSEIFALASATNSYVFPFNVNLSSAAMSAFAPVVWTLAFTPSARVPSLTVSPAVVFTSVIAAPPSPVTLDVNFTLSPAKAISNTEDNSESLIAL